MPPLSFTQLKYAFAICAPSVKSVPGCLVTIAPSLIGVPVALTPGFVPHFVTSPAAAVVLLPPPPLDVLLLLLLLLPHAETTTESPTSNTSIVRTDRAFREPRCFLTAPPPRVNTSRRRPQDRKSTRLNSSHLVISYAVFCLKKKIDAQAIPPEDQEPEGERERVEYGQDIRGEHTAAGTGSSGQVDDYG